MLVRIDNDTIHDMLMNRLSVWTDDPIAHELFSQYYERNIENGAYENSDFDPMVIVDNDYVNWFNVMDKDELATSFNEDEEDTKERILATTTTNNKTYYLVYMC